MSKDGDIEELPSSQLGTNEYWDQFYSKELENFSDNKDEGEIWFGHTRMMKVVKWIINNSNINKDAVVLDIGCGNGAFLLELADEGYTQLYGLDYSPSGIDLAKKIAIEHQKIIQYQQADFLDSKSISYERMFDVCHDKGTYDAISLRPNDVKVSRQKYIETLQHVIKDSGMFVITSCNWTLEELKIHFTTEFHYMTHIPAPTFQYGGQSGSTVSTAVFLKT